MLPASFLRLTRSKGQGEAVKRAKIDSFISDLDAQIADLPPSTQESGSRADSKADAIEEAFEIMRDGALAAQVVNRARAREMTEEWTKDCRRHQPRILVATALVSLGGVLEVASLVLE